MLVLITLHLIAAAVAPVLTRWMGRRAFVVLAVAPAVAFGWVVAQTGQVTGTGGRPVSESIVWVQSLQLQLDFRLATLQWVMALLVTGIGALVLLYCASYFRPDDVAMRRFGGVFTAFAGAMLGLVVADDLVLLYVFWELTTVFSYLLIGHNPERMANRRAAMQALIVTTFGGLAMFVGVLMVGESAGTYRISAILEAPPTGTAITVAVVLLLVGAVSKSALIPFHFWLPGAMAAPTPVSAYLHAAAMVKAGVYLVALLAPAYADLMPWRPLLLVLGVGTMLLGALRALRQTDLKLLLAHGTVSQLGFIIVLVGVGTRAAALAGVAMIVAHALFKATLFLVVGVIDRATGTRDLRELTGLRRRMPVMFCVALLASGSMAAIMPLAGFVAKESALGAFVDIAVSGDGTGMGKAMGWLTVAGLVTGSALTVAYTARFVWGAFADRPTAHDIPERPEVSWAFAAAPVLLGVAGLALGFLGELESEILSPYFDLFPQGAHEPELALWHGFSPALWLSVLAIGAGLTGFALRDRVAALQDRWRPRAEAEPIYHRMMRAVDRAAVEVTGATQRGSLPIYLAVILLVLVVVPGGALLANRDWGPVHLWDSPAQALVAAVMAIAALEAAKARRRLKAVVLSSIVGYGMVLLFALHGAPDLALTQVLVETVTLVIFVLVLRRLPPYFASKAVRRTGWWRAAIGLAVGVTMGGVAFAASGARVATPISVNFAESAYDFGGGRNIVNVTLVDIRAWDTMGEISVLVVAATGVASLIFLISGRTGRAGRSARFRPDAAIAAARGGTRPPHGGGQHSTWLRAGRTIPSERRSTLFEVVTRLIFHVIIVFSIYLLFSGHNVPGGGFAGGLVAGLALMVRYLAAGRHELDEAAPVDAGVVLGGGLVVATGSALAPLLFGGEALRSYIVDLHVPLLGNVHVVTSLIFDIGVYLVVVGLMLDVLRSLGGGIDRQAQSSSEDDDDAPETNLVRGRA